MTLPEFKDIAAGLQSIAITAATILGGGWALFQFFSLRSLEKAKLELEKAQRELLQRGIIIIELRTNPMEDKGLLLVHVVVSIRNVGNGFEIADWTKASLHAKKVEEVVGGQVGFSDQRYVGQRSFSIDIQQMRLMPGYFTKESFLIPVPGPGIYYVEFSIPCSPMVASSVTEDLAALGRKVSPEDSILWKADTFVTVGNG